MNEQPLKALAQALDWMYKPTEDKDRQKVLEYMAYERQVINRAANSIGCQPIDLKDREYLVLDMFLDGLDQFEAAICVEQSLGDECYYYTNVVPFSNQKAPF